jgi:hypothetical protein
MGATAEKIDIANGEELAAQFGYEIFDSFYRKTKRWIEQSGSNVPLLLKSEAVAQETLEFICAETKRDPSVFRLINEPSAGRATTTVRPSTITRPAQVVVDTEKQALQERAEAAEKALEKAKSDNATLELRRKQAADTAEMYRKAKQTADEAIEAEKNAAKAEREKRQSDHREELEKERVKTREAQKEISLSVKAERDRLTDTHSTLLESEKSKIGLIDKNASAEIERLKQEKIDAVNTEKQRNETTITNLRLQLKGEQEKARNTESEAQRKLREQKEELTDSHSTILESEKGKIDLIKKNAFAEAEANFLKDSETRIQEIVAERVGVITKQQNGAMQALKNVHSSELAAKVGEIATLTAKNEALQKVVAQLKKRLATEWGLWKFPTKLEWINIVSNIAALVGLYFIHPFFGTCIWCLFALFFSETVHLVKDAQSKKAADTAFYTTLGIEIIYGIIHVSTFKKILEGNKNLIGGAGAQGAYSWIGAVIMSFMSIIALNVLWKKTQDSML